MSLKKAVSVKRGGLSHNINAFKRGMELMSSMLATKKVRMVFRGTECAVDQAAGIIYLPDLSLLERPNMTDEDVKEAQAFLDAVRGFAIHEVSHVLFTDNEVFQRGVKEGPLVKMAMNAVEDPRIEKLMAQKWRGAGVSLRHMNEWMLSKVQAELGNAPIIGKVIVGIAWVARTGTNHWFYKGLDAQTKALLGKFGAEIRAVRNLDSTEEALVLGRRIVKKLRDMGEGKEPEKGPAEPQRSKGPKGGDPGEESGEEGGESEGEEGEGEPVKKGKKGKDKAGKKPKGKKGKARDEADEEGEDDEGEADDEGEEEGEEGEGSSEGSGDADDEGEEGGSEDGGDDDGDSADGGDGGVDDEVDAEALKDALDQLKKEVENHLDQSSIQAEQMTDKGRHIGSFIQPHGASEQYRVYTTEFDTYEKARACDLPTYQHMMTQARAHFGVMKRNLANLLKARANVLTISELEEGDLDTTMLYRLANGLGDKVFKEDFEHLDTTVAVVLLVNESGSMGGWAGDGMTRVELARITAALLGEVMDSLGVKFAVYGHTTGNNAHQVYSGASASERELFTRWGATVINVYKDFDESFAATKVRIPSMRARNNTHDGDALVIAANKLLAVKGVERRIIMTLDDGAPEPNLPGYSCYGLAQKHQDYVREVVGKLALQHVEVIGMGMGTDSVKEFYPQHVVVNDVASFPAIAMKEFKRLLLTPKKKA